jgi:hypothetical protein
MEFAVVHEISDPAAWQEVLDAEHSWPEGFTLLAFAEAKDRSRAMCLWRAPDQAVLQARLDENLGRGAVNLVMPVDLRHLGDPGPS